MFRILLFSLAICAGGIAGWLALASPPRAALVAGAPEPSPMVDVLVASGNIEQGQVIAPENMKWQAWPAGVVQPNFVTRTAQPEAINELTGAIVRSPIFSGELILSEKIAPAGSGFLSALLGSGKRAVGVRVSAESSAGGFIRPNDRVDVLNTIPCQGQDGCQSGSEVKTILRNVRVLAVDQIGTRDETETVGVGKTATLELEPWQAETIISAQASGMLTLVLRPAVETGEVSGSDKPLPRTVRVRRAGIAETVTFQ